MDSPWDDNATQQTASNAEWAKLSSEFTTAGYREGITAGKEAALQEGFDAGFAQVGVPLGRQLGILRGTVSALVAFFQSNLCQREDKDTLLVEARAIAVALADVRFTDIAPRDLEAEAHAREHLEADQDEFGMDENPELQEKRDMEALEDMVGRLTAGATKPSDAARPTSADVQKLAERIQALSRLLDLDIEES
ncbi:Yae1-N domain-containing protein [Mycena kentingensis (nom. inval.)]|nr:Yae1-N domain-containing protein [Mycena kentingensis (nom. inval.)]